MEYIMWLTAVIWAICFLQWCLNCLLIKELGDLNYDIRSELPFVSIVVPARNEERSIGKAVSSFCEQDYPAFEVIVVNDCSSDSTGNILEELSLKYSNLCIINGTEPPEGWLGKPNSLEIGKNTAKGDWVLFVDADVHYKPDLLKRAVNYAISEKAGMLFLLPRIVTRGIVEPAVLSILALVAFGAAPLFLVQRTKWKFLACGGGVFNLVRKDVLNDINAFYCIKDAVIDDVALGYAVKRRGYKLAVARAVNHIDIRMYHGAEETLNGFTKNLFPPLRKISIMFFLPFITGFFMFLFPYIMLMLHPIYPNLTVPAVASLIAMHSVFAQIAVTFRMPWYLILLPSLSDILWRWIMIKSYWIYRRKGIVWRGRNYKPL